MALPCDKFNVILRGKLGKYWMDGRTQARWFPQRGDIVMLPVTSKAMKLSPERRRYEIGLVVGQAVNENAIKGALWDILILDGVKTIHIQSIKPLFDEDGECLDTKIIK